MTLTNDEYRTIVNALRVAAELYNAEAHTMTEAGQVRIARQFDAQETEARRLANAIEEEIG